MLWFVTFRNHKLINFQFFWGTEEELHQAFIDEFPQGRVLLHGWVEVSEFQEEDIDLPSLSVDTAATLDALEYLKQSGRTVIYRTHIWRLKAS